MTRLVSASFVINYPLTSRHYKSETMSSDNDSLAVRRIVIVGGGTAGWMTAAYLAKFTQLVGCEITLIESPDQPTIGVGEASIPSLVRFVRNLGFDEVEMMKYCHATYKLGIRFEDWTGKGNSFWHPFGVCGSRINHADLFHFWYRENFNGNDVIDHYSQYSLQVKLCEQNKAPRSFRDQSPLMESGGYAYHLDSHRFAEYLKAKAIPMGVLHYLENVNAVERGSDGQLISIRTETNNIISGDLFIDCTGFESLLIERELESGFEHWDDELLCDRAIACRSDAMEPLPPYTISRSLSAGWAWRIPLSTNTGFGYVYSSKHLRDAEAKEELATQFDLNADLLTKPPIKMQIGCRPQSWVHNCVAIGLSSGFTEPLESSGIHMIQLAIETLLDRFPDKTMNSSLQDSFNARIYQSFMAIKDFLSIHYLFSTTEDGAFWEDARNVAMSPRLNAILESYREHGWVDIAGDEVFGEASFHHLLNGCSVLPRRPHLLSEMVSKDEIITILEQIRGRNSEITSKMPEQSMLIDFFQNSP